MAVWLSALVGVLGILTLATPARHDVPGVGIVVTIVVSALTFFVCWYQWQFRRWAAVAVTAVNGFQLLSSVLSLIDGVNAWTTGFIIAAIPLSAVAIVFTWLPASRRVYR